MKLNPRMYSGDRMPQPETGSSGNVVNVKSWDAIMRRDMFTPSIRESGLDLAEIEWQARAAQSAWIARHLKSYFAALMRKLGTKADISAATSVLKGVENKAA